jgi:hypothetical protein
MMPIAFSVRRVLYHSLIEVRISLNDYLIKSEKELNDMSHQYGSEINTADMRICTGESHVTILTKELILH